MSEFSLTDGELRRQIFLRVLVLVLVTELVCAIISYILVLVGFSFNATLLAEAGSAGLVGIFLNLVNGKLGKVSLTLSNGVLTWHPVVRRRNRRVIGTCSVVNIEAVQVVRYGPLVTVELQLRNERDVRLPVPWRFFGFQAATQDRFLAAVEASLLSTA